MRSRSVSELRGAKSCAWAAPVASAKAQPATNVLIQGAMVFLRWNAGLSRGRARDRRSGADQAPIGASLTMFGRRRRRRSGADQGLVDDPLAGDGVLAPERLPEPIVAVEPVGDGGQAPDGRDVRLALGHRVEAARVGKGVEVEGTVVAVVADLTEQLERRAQMHRAHHK